MSSILPFKTLQKKLIRALHGPSESTGELQKMTKNITSKLYIIFEIFKHEF